MSRGLITLLVLAGCGRINFPELAPTGDASADAPGGDAAAPAWSHLIAYAFQTCAVYRGTAYCWGNNANGQIGDGTTAPAPIPTKVALPVGSIDDLTQGETQGCAIVSGTLYCWGAFGTPGPVAVLLAQTATSVSAGRNFQCVVAGETWCWGPNGTGQLGTGDTTMRAAPTAINYAGAALVAVRAGDDHVCAIDVTNVAHCWGHNDLGTLGTGSNTPNSSSTPQTVIGGVATLPLIAGWHACALRTTGDVDCWGEGDNGELGNGGTVNTPTPQPVPSLASVTALATGGGPTDADASCAIVAGKVTCWGNGFYGRLGQGSANPSTMPVDVVGLPGPASSVAIGYDHACALLADGDIWCWGRGDHGELGNGLTQSSLAPVLVVRPS